MPFSHLQTFYRDSFGLLTDLYQLTMAYGYWQQRLHHRPAVFHLFYRRPPFEAEPITVAGLELVVDFLRNFRFEVSDIQYLGGLRDRSGKPLFPEAFLHYLQRLRFSGSLYALPEGRIAFPQEPILRVEAPLLEAQLIETALLNLVNYSSLVATKARRIVQAAQGGAVLEFGLRRAQGIDGGLTASRAAYIGGCAATSNVLAGKHYGIPVKGTHAHAWVMVFEDELEAFRAYAEAFPTDCIFLVDTYDSIEGVQRAIRIGAELRSKGFELKGIRLDSGDLAALSKEARGLLDRAGFPDVQIVASNDLDEYRIAELLQRDAAIDTWGIGTRLVTAFDQPALTGVYKLSAIQDTQGRWQDRIKLSERAAKRSLPGRQQIWRGYDQEDRLVFSLISNADTDEPDERMVPFDEEEVHPRPVAARSEALLQPIFDAGKVVYDPPSLKDLQARAAADFHRYANRNASSFTFGMDMSLHDRQERLANALSS